MACGQLSCGSRRPATCSGAARREERTARRRTVPRSAVRLASLPVTLGEKPAIALMHPMVGYPALVRVRVLIMTGDPHVPTAFPTPVATEPDISGGGRRTVFLDPDRGWGHHDSGAYVIPARGRRSDYASTKSYRQHGNCYQLGCVKTELTHMHSHRIDGGRHRFMVIGWLTTMALIVALPA
jgi:hypothetical protein